MNEATRLLLNSLGAKVTACGSRVTCNPPPTNTDEDFLVFIDEKHISKIFIGLSGLGYLHEGDSYSYEFELSSFSSWRVGWTNLIVTASEDFASRHKAATNICKTLNVMDKKHRIMIFQAVLYGKVWQK